MNWIMPYPCRSRRDSVRRINMSSEPGNESFFCALRPIPRILSLQPREYASQDPTGALPPSTSRLRPDRQPGTIHVERVVAYGEECRPDRERPVRVIRSEFVPKHWATRSWLL